MNELLSAALIYATKAGWRIFPCKLNKSPYTDNGFYDATTDSEQIIKWWTRWPDASIGCATGPDSGFWVLDVDMPNGPDSLRKLEQEYGNLPNTRMQKTGSGGTHLFFIWNGVNIRNSSSKIGYKLDIRGDGGYIILPPSNYPSGNRYEWICRPQIATAPKWLTNLIIGPDSINIPPLTPLNGNTTYGLKALSDEIINVSSQSEGTRNNTLNLAALRLGQLVAGGELEETHVYNSLIGASHGTGLTEKEAKKTIQSGMAAGREKPRKAPEKESDNYYLDDGVSNVSIVSNVIPESGCKQAVSKTAKVVSSCKQNGQSCKQDVSNNDLEPPANLMAHIELFIENSSGCFTTRDIDNEFGLKTRKEKNARSRALNYMARKRLIIKDKAAAGKWHIINKEIEFVDLDAPAEEAYNISLPFGLNNHVLIPPHSIIVIAGSGDAGKTTFILNILKQNRGKEYDKFYLMSEMGRGEYIRKIKMFGEPLEHWKCIKAAPRSYDFNGVIEHHNKHGLTCIDYLEEIQGEYFKITSQIRDIYDALGDGVAVVAIQKDSKAAYARGGEGTMEKSRLYLSIDYLCTVPRGVVCAIKIMKAKNFINDNYKNHELHFKIHGRNEMEVLMDWTPSSKVDRKKMTAIYESDRDPEEVASRDYAYTFKTMSGKLVGVNYDQRDRWMAEFGYFVDDELFKLQESSHKKPFLKDKWFFQVAGILAKRKEQQEQKEEARHRADIDG